MRNFKLTVCYDGTDFCGWQMQPGQATIQGTLVDVASKLTQEEIQMFGAGRTDAGVHALGQVANFCTGSGLSAADFKRAFNALLPPAIRVLRCEEAAPDFHARFQALAKTYQYRIHCGRVLLPFDGRYVLHDPIPLDVQAMAKAARVFEGVHDFSSFAASSGDEETDRTRLLTREIYGSMIYVRAGHVLDGSGFLGKSNATPVSAETIELKDAENMAVSDIVELIYVVRGKSFLRNMVRKIVGTLLDVGHGKLQPEEIPERFEMRDRSRSGPTAEPQGLYLVSVEYPETISQNIE
jgi:tRNA pseudouridine38-40 synthase